MSATRAAWLVVLVLWPVALLNYLDRQMLAAMKFSVMALRDARVPLDAIFGAFSGAAVFSVILVLLIRPREELENSLGDRADGSPLGGI